MQPVSLLIQTCSIIQNTDLLLRSREIKIFYEVWRKYERLLVKHQLCHSEGVKTKAHRKLISRGSPVSVHILGSVSYTISLSKHLFLWGKKNWGQIEFAFLIFIIYCWYISLEPKNPGQKVEEVLHEEQWHDFFLQGRAKWISWLVWI